jgi:nitrogen fixation protein FixH
VNGALAYFATSTFNGLETRNAYEKGRLYNQTLAEAEAQKALGWSAAIESRQLPGAASGEYVADLLFAVSDADGAGLEGLQVTAEVRRPTQAGMDREVVLSRRDAGRYGTKVTLPEPGQWEVRVLATREEESFRLRDRILLK